MDVFRTLVVTAEHVDLARALAASFGSGGEGMWTAGLSATAAEPVTHYVSTGLIPEEFAGLLADPAAVWQAALAQGVSCTLAEVEAVFSSADISEDVPFLALERLGLKMVHPTEI